MPGGRGWKVGFGKKVNGKSGEEEGKKERVELEPMTEIKQREVFSSLINGGKEEQQNAERGRKKAFKGFSLQREKILHSAFTMLL